jgi:hypothetical protein
MASENSGREGVDSVVEKGWCKEVEVVRENNRREGEGEYVLYLVPPQRP